MVKLATDNRATQVRFLEVGPINKLTLEDIDDLKVAAKIPFLTERLLGCQKGRDLRAAELRRIRKIDKAWARWHWWSQKRINEVRGRTTVDRIDRIRRKLRIYGHSKNR